MSDKLDILSMLHQVVSAAQSLEYADLVAKSYIDFSGAILNDRRIVVTEETILLQYISISAPYLLQSLSPYLKFETLN